LALNSALKIQSLCHIDKNIRLQTAFSAILPTGNECTVNSYL